MPLTHAIGNAKTKQVVIWVEGEFDADGTLRFEVLNGAWSGTIDVHGTVLVDNSEAHFNQAILWSGEVPNDIANPIKWIQSVIDNEGAPAA